LIRDSQLKGMQMERHDAGSTVSRPARMGDSPEPSPNHHVTRRAHLGAGVDIPKDKKRSRSVPMVARSQGALMNRQRW
jgi:hypothetical protein